MSLPFRTAYVADHTSLSTGPPAGGWSSVVCAVVVESRESVGLRAEVQDIIAEYAGPAAKPAGGYEPTFSLLFWLSKAPVRCIVTRHQGSAGTSRHDEQVRHSSADAMVEALVADRVDIVVLRGSGTSGPQVMITEGGVTPTVRLLRSDVMSEPLLSLPEAVAWAYYSDLGSTTRMLADRTQVLDVG